MWLVWSAVALAASPTVTVAWKGEQGTLTVDVPEGLHVAAAAPLDVSLRWTVGGATRELTYSGAGGDLPLPVDAIRGASVEGVFTVPLCDDTEVTCAPVTFAVEGTVPVTSRGSLRLAAVADEPHGPVYQTDADAVAQAAFAQAAAQGRRVLLDFGAVWCPPCNALNAEVLHADPAPAELDAVVVAALDVDDPRSWGLKDRYQIGGYPTLVVTLPDGTELDRLVGYPGREAFLEWLAGAAGREIRWDPSAADPATVTPAEAAGIALRLVEAGSGDPKPWLERAASGELGEAEASLRLARVRVSPTVDDARWLAEHAPGKALSWVPGTGDLDQDPDAREVLRAAVTDDLRHAQGAEVADLLWVLGQLSDEADQPALFASAAASLRTALTGEPAHDRAHLTFLADLLAASGDVDAALEVLTQASADWPGEPTFELSAAGLLNQHGRFADALLRADAALSTAWGDNRLRAATAKCAALVGLDRAEEASAVAAQVLAASPEPSADLEVRTHRYREKLAKFVLAK